MLLPLLQEPIASIRQLYWRSDMKNYFNATQVIFIIILLPLNLDALFDTSIYTHAWPLSIVRQSDIVGALK